MTNAESMNKKEGSLKPRLRNVLLVVQILLPFMGFVALQNGNGLWAGVIAALFAFSMLMLVVVG